MKELEQKVALVTSSTRGIGLACAKALAAQGAAVYLGVRRLDAGQKIADELIAAGGRAGVVYFDASNEESFTGMVDEVAAKEGRLDILVNNFGSTDVKTDLDVVSGDTEDFFRIVNTNLKSVYLPSKAAVPLMAKNGGGSIINIGSVGGIYEAPVEEQNFSTLIEFINAMEVREDDEEFKNPVDLMFDELESRNPSHFAVRQYKKYKLAAGDVCSK